MFFIIIPFLTFNSDSIPNDHQDNILESAKVFMPSAERYRYPWWSSQWLASPRYSQSVAVYVYLHSEPEQLSQSKFPTVSFISLIAWWTSAQTDSVVPGQRWLVHWHCSPGHSMVQIRIIPLRELSDTHQWCVLSHSSLLSYLPSPSYRGWVRRSHDQCRLHEWLSILLASVSLCRQWIVENPQDPMVEEQASGFREESRVIIQWVSEITLSAPIRIEHSFDVVRPFPFLLASPLIPVSLIFRNQEDESGDLNEKQENRGMTTSLASMHRSFNVILSNPCRRSMLILFTISPSLSLDHVPIVHSRRIAIECED